MRVVSSPCRRHLSALLLALGSLAGCGERSPEESLAEAKRALAAQDERTAVVHLKSALQQRSEFGEARYLLGRTMLERGDAGPASIELRKALAGQHPPSEVVPLLARALLMQGQSKQVIDELGATTLDGAVATADLKAALAQAYAAKGLPDRAHAAMADALAAVPEHVPTLLLQAREKWAARDVPGATVLVDRALAKAPDHPDALLLRADLFLLAGDESRAIEAHRRVLATHPSNLVAHAGLMNILATGKDPAASDAALAAMKKSHPGHWLTHYFSARVAVQKGDKAKANQMVEQLLKQAPEQPQVLQLAGALAFESKSLLKAQQLLGKALQAEPRSDITRRLLVQTYLNGGEPAKALEAAQPLLREAPTAADLSLVALAHSMQGDAERAEEFYRRASTADPKNARTQTALALTRLSAGKTTALKDLESVATWDTGISSDLALVRVHIARKEHDAALKAIDALEQKQPGVAMNAYLRGLVLQRKGDAPGARAAYEGALKVDPAYFPAVSRLAALDLATGAAAQAGQRLEAFLKAKPTHAAALVTLAQLRIMDRKRDEAEALLQRAVRDNPGEVAPRLALIRQALADGQPGKALAAAEAAAAAIPNRVEILHAVAQALFASGDYQRTLSTLNRVVALSPSSAGPHIDIALTYAKLKDRRAAIDSARRAIELAPSELQGRFLMARLLVEDDRAEEARAIAREIQKSRPSEAAGYTLEGDIEVAGKRFKTAEAAYRTALAKKGGTQEAVKLHAALLAIGDGDKAHAMATWWLQQHPTDVGFRFNLGTAALVRHEYAEAVDQLTEVLKVRPDDPILLNNVAYAMVQAKRPGALPLAERADRARPDFPPILHTYAIALAAEGKLDKAIEVQKKAASLKPDDPAQRLALARLYLKAGDRGQARQQVHTIADAKSMSASEQQELTELRKAVE